MFIFGVLLAHFIGDYVLQNNAMAKYKTSNTKVAFIHGFIQGLLLEIVVMAFYPNTIWWVVYTIFLITWLSHSYIDRYRLAKPIIWAINQIAPKSERYPWYKAKENNGHSFGTPNYMSNWLMIIFDNTLHLTITFILLVVFIHGA